jgi:hypothetical protein
MAVDDEPEDDLPLDPPDEEVEQDEQETDPEEAEGEPEEAEPEAAGEQDRQPGEQRQPSRRDSRIETLTNSVKEERQRRAELERRLDSLLAGQVKQPSLGESQEQRAQRLALLTPEERITETLRESEQRHAVEMRTLQFSIADGNDRAAFEAKATVDPLYAKWKSRVDEELGKLRQQGQNVDREKLMDYLIGKNARESRQKNGNQQRVAAGRRVAAQRTRPSNSGSDTSTTRTRNTSLERRLENQSI